MHKTIILSLVLVITQAFGQAPLDAIYRDGLNAAQSNMQKSIDSLNNLNPSEAFKDQNGKSYYTDKPEQISHYQGVVGGNRDVLDDAGRTRIDQNEATKEIWNSFGNPKITLDPNGADKGWLGKSNDIIKNSADITMGTSSQPNEVVKNGVPAGVNCKEAKICRIELVKKTCNEQVNHPLKKVCEKVPKITTSTREVVYPGCQNLIVTKGAPNGCPGGYSQILYADMVQYVDWDDIRFCTKPAGGGECYSGGYYVVRSVDGNFGSERATVPKKLYARIRISNAYFGSITGTIINETTGQSVCSNCSFSDGQVIALPYSETQDQIFRFYATSSCNGRFCRTTGVMVLYIDHSYRETVANLESWLEINCNGG